MDIFKLNLGSKLMNKMVSKFITKQIFKKTGYKIELNLDELNVDFVDGDAVAKVSAEVRLDKKEFVKIIQDMDLI